MAKKSPERGKPLGAGAGQEKAHASGGAGRASGFPENKQALLLCLVLAALTFAAFLPALKAGFVNYDDNVYVTLNDHVRQGLSWQGLKWALTTNETGNWHPVTWVTHMLDWQLYGSRAWGHHLTSLVLHAANTVLVFILFWRMTGSMRRSFLLAGLFGLHPVHVESVAWVAERKDVLSTLFLLLTLWAYLRFVRDPPRLDKLALGLAFFAVGLMCKPMLVTLPFLLLLVDWWPLRRLRWSPSAPISEPSGRVVLAPSPARLGLEKLPFFLLAAASSVVTYLVQESGGAVAPSVALPLTARLENALVSHARYLGKLFWPADLAVFYPHPVHWTAVAVIGSGLVLAALSILALIQWSRRPYLLVGWLWFVGTLVPVIGLVQVGLQSMADRYLYIPSIGLFLSLIWLAHELTQRWKWRDLGFKVVTATCLLGLAALTYRQAAFWHDTETLFQHALAVTDGNHVAHVNLGNLLQSQGKMDEALPHLEEAVRLKPGDPETHGSLGNALCRKGRLADGLAQFEIALRLNPKSFEAHYNFGIAICNAGRLDDGIAQFRECLRLKPDSPEAHRALAVALAGKGKKEEALSHLDEALRLRPDFPAARRMQETLTRRP